MIFQRMLWFKILAHVFNPRTQEAEASQLLWFWGQSGLQSKSLDSQGYKGKSCLTQAKQNKQKLNIAVLLFCAR